METLPARSSGVLVAPVGDGALAYDLMTETAHRLNATAGLLLSLCDGQFELEGLIADWAQVSGVARDQVKVDVERALDTFAELALVGRAEVFVAPDATPTTTSGAATPDAADLSAATPDAADLSPAYAAIDYRVAFRSNDGDLLEAVVDHLGPGLTGPGLTGPGSTDTQPNVIIDIRRNPGGDPDGEFVIATDAEYRSTDRNDFLARLTMVLNEHAVTSRSCVVLHAGAVRSPDGQILLLPAHSGSGKSTLTAALVASGWDYLGDEAIGVRAGTLQAVGYPKLISIDAASQKALGLTPGGNNQSATTDDADPTSGPAVDPSGSNHASGSNHPSGSINEDIDAAALRPEVMKLAGDCDVVARVILPTFIDGATTSLKDLSDQEAAIYLLANALNLARVGQIGLETLCALAESVPVQRLEHGGVDDAVAAIEEAMATESRT